MPRSGGSKLLTCDACQVTGIRCDCAEVASIAVIEAGAGSNPQLTICILFKRQDIAIQKALFRANSGVCGAVEFVQAVLSADPHHSSVVLQNAVHGKAVQPLIVTVLLKGILLRGAAQDNELAQRQDCDQ